jgi:hypothetical protein
MASLSPQASFQSGPADQSETFGIIGAIVDFQADSQEGPITSICCKKPPLKDLLNRYVHEIMADETIKKRCESPTEDGEKCLLNPVTRFRWIHVPVNKMNWVQVSAISTSCFVH